MKYLLIVFLIVLASCSQDQEVVLEQNLVLEEDNDIEVKVREEISEVENIEEEVVKEEPKEEVSKEILPGGVRLAFIGDQGLNDNSKAVLNLVKEEDTEVLIHLGDFDYASNPGLWKQQFDEILGEDFTIIAVIGNHDIDAWPEYQKDLLERLERTPEVKCTGDYGARSICKYKHLSFVQVAPHIIEPNTYAEFIRDNFSQEENTWKICMWHKLQRLMQVGGKGDRVGWGVYEECRKQGAIVATAHEHSYVRTHLMSSFETQEIASTSNVLQLEEGKSFAFVSALGGKSVRVEKDNLGSNPWWASIYTSDRGGTHGALFCTFYDAQADCYFKDINGKIVDEFKIKN